MSLQKSVVYRERQYKSPHVAGYSSSRGHRDDFVLYDDEITHRSRSPPRLTFFGEEQPKGHRYRAQDESALVQRNRASVQGFSTDSTRGPPQDYLRRVPGSRNTAKEPQYCGDLGKTVPRRSKERQPAYVPAAPVIPRLPSPDFYTKPLYDDSEFAEYDFCPCCPPGVRDKRHDVRWKKGKAKMDRQGMSCHIAHSHFTRCIAGRKQLTWL